jgi:CCR4-NOT transcriptional regulation complex NOT5 subunit
MHQFKEADMMSAKLDLIIKKLEEQDIEKKEVMHINDSRMTYEECGDVGYSGNNCPIIQEDVSYINNNNSYRPQPN